MVGTMLSTFVQNAVQSFVLPLSTHFAKQQGKTGSVFWTQTQEPLVASRLILYPSVYVSNSTVAADVPRLLRPVLR